MQVLSSTKPVRGFQGGTVRHTTVTKMEKIRHGFGHYSSYTFYPIWCIERLTTSFTVSRPTFPIPWKRGTDAWTTSYHYTGDSHSGIQKNKIEIQQIDALLEVLGLSTFLIYLVFQFEWHSYLSDTLIWVTFQFVWHSNFCRKSLKKLT